MVTANQIDMAFPKLTDNWMNKPQHYGIHAIGYYSNSIGELTSVIIQSNNNQMSFKCFAVFFSRVVLIIIIIIIREKKKKTKKFAYAYRAHMA